MKLYSMKDVLADQFAPVFSALSDAVAIRQARTLLEGIPASVRGDYQLYRCGEFDEKKGCILVDDTEPLLVFANFNLAVEVKKNDIKPA